MRTSTNLFLLLPLTLLFTNAFAQDYQRCGTALLLERNLEKEPLNRAILNLNEQRLQNRLMENSGRLKSNGSATVTIPVVFHIVMSNPNQVTDGQVIAQLQLLNEAYSGIHADTSRIPLHFKSLAGRSLIQFCLAQRTPGEAATNGIVRYTTSSSSFTVESEKIKYASSGGADAWNPKDYLNIWVGNISGSILGYSSFPGIGAASSQGVVIHYGSLPGGSLLNYNKGKTLVHETGHYFFLYHIWGDDNGGCTGTDQVDDTPNQSNATTGCPGSVVTDNCNRTTSGIMFQNYMDYSHDNCLLMFTNDQVARMETALNTYHASLLDSKGCLPMAEYTRNVEIKSIISPAQRICTGSLSPSFTIRNMGKENLSTLMLHVQIDQQPPMRIQWTGSIASLSSATINAAVLTTTAGNHVLTVYTSDPNGQEDEYPRNDTMRFAFMYYPPSNPPYLQRFEETTFPPTAWDIINNNAGSNGWERISSVTGKTGAAAVVRNYGNAKKGAKDFFRLPGVNLPAADSAFITFQYAAVNSADTLELMISTDCGKTYSPLYRKTGAGLATRATAANGSFLPATNEWKKDSVALTPWLGRDNLMLAFVNSNGSGNNIYLDDVNVYTKTVNPFLKSAGFLISPNPARNQVAVEFYPTPSNLQRIDIFSTSGQLLTSLITAKHQRNVYNFDVSGWLPGMYVIKVTYTDRSITRKLVKVE